MAGGAREQWGDKWTEQFGGGTGTKHGEVWNVDAAGHRCAARPRGGDLGGWAGATLRDLPEGGCGAAVHTAKAWPAACVRVRSVWMGRYQRWWNEHHQGERRVRKWGNSTAGEYWDAVEEMDTYYNPVPHFG